MTPDRIPPTLSEALTKFATVFDTGQSPDRAAQVIVDLAKQTLPESDGVGMTLRDGDGFITMALTDPWVQEVDDVQYRHDDGPCLQGIRENKVVHAPQLASNDAWGPVGPEAGALGVLSSLTVPLRSGEGAIGGLNIYSRSAGSFDETSEELGRCLAGPAAAVYMRVRAHEDSVELTKQLEEALTSRATIEQAKGILIATRRCTPDEAFEVLKRTSQHSNIKLRKVAEQVVIAFSAGKEWPLPPD